MSDKLPTLVFQIATSTGKGYQARADVQAAPAGRVALNLLAPFGLTVGGTMMRHDAAQLAVLLWRAAEASRDAQGADPHETPPNIPDGLRRASLVDHGAL